jgi:predicted O-methyltransferase YrrM
VENAESAPGPAPGNLPLRDGTELRVAVVVHLYYHHLWPEFAAHIRNVPAPFTLFLTIPENSPAEAAILADFPLARVRRVANVGRDVAPFLALLPELLAFDVVCKVHTKRDTPVHREWRIACLDGLLGSRRLVEQVLDAFAGRPNLMLAGPRDMFLDGHVHIASMEATMRAFSNPLPEAFGFMAGTMFWARPAAFASLLPAFPQSLFVQHGDADGQPEHAVERLFGERVATLGGDLALLHFDGGEPAIEITSGRRPGLTEPWRATVKEKLVPRYGQYPVDWHAGPAMASADTGPPPSLAELYAAHDGYVSDKWESYTGHYERVLAPYRRRIVSILEIGIQNGGSLELLARAFPHAAVLLGCDVNPGCAALRFDDPRIHVVIGDAGDRLTARDIGRISPSFDIVIDDGSHRSGDIVRAFANYFPRIADGGVFIAEDLHCSYWHQYDGGLDHRTSSIAFFKALADVINHEHWQEKARPGSRLRAHFRAHGAKMNQEALAHIHSVEFVNSMCIVHKRAPEHNTLGRRRIVGRQAAVVPEVPAQAGTMSTPLRKRRRKGGKARNRPPLLVRVALRLDRALSPLKRLVLRGRRKQKGRPKGGP